MTRLTTSALAIAAAAFATGVDAQDMGLSGIVTAEQSGNLISAENLTDAEIYTLGAEYDEETWGATPYYDTVGTEWEDIGDVEDIVMSRDGQLIGIIAEVGGWLDIGDSDVVLSLDDVRIVGGGMDSGLGDEVALVTRLSEEQIEGMNSIDDGWFGN